MPAPDTAPRERLRQSFRPAHLRLLFIGESPPASGRFFYQKDSGLYRAMRDVFQAIDPSLTDETFLMAFQASGCYLIDLSLDPVDHLDPKPRRIACRNSEPSLSRAIGQLQPPRIATLLRSIEPNVHRAALAANWSGPLLHLPYPGRWARHKAAFTKVLTPTIATLFSPLGW